MKVKILPFCLIIPLTISINAEAQNFNYRYDFRTDHFNSTHLCADEVLNDILIVGSTIDGPQPRTIQLSVMDPATGYTAGPARTYLGDGEASRAADLIQSSGDPEWVVTAGDYLPYADPNVATIIFKTNPRTGAVAWARHYGKTHYFYTSNFTATAIASNEEEKIYYVIGDAEFYDDNNVFRRAIYLFAIDDQGNPKWERYYTDPYLDPALKSSDLIYDPLNKRLIIAAKIFPNQTTGGAVIAVVDKNTGNLLAEKTIPKIAGTNDFTIRDATLANGRYVFVGEVNTIPKKGFIFQLKPGLTAHTPFLQVYSTGTRTNLKLTGIRMKARSDLYASIETQAGSLVQPYPGLLEMDENGKYKSAYIYKVDNYEASVGLLDVYGERRFMVKGSTGFDENRDRRLSLVYSTTPLQDNEDLCPKQIKLYTSDELYLIEHHLEAHQLETSVKTEMVVGVLDDKIYDCNDEVVDKPRLAAPGSETSDEAFEALVFPNPTAGKLMFRLNETAADQLGTVYIYNALGKKVKTVIINNSNPETDLSGSAPGIYFISFIAKDGSVIKHERAMLK